MNVRPYVGFLVKSVRPFAFILVGALLSPVSALDITNKDCLECHSDIDLSKELPDGKTLSLYINDSIFKSSIHGNFSCIKCHDDIFEIPHQEEVNPVKCGKCHQKEIEGYSTSIHGVDFIQGDPDVPTCHNCHGKHNIRAVEDPSSMVFRANLTKVCLRCHTDEKITTEHKLPGVEVIKAYEKSVHGRALLETGLTIAAECGDCHGSHSIEPADDPRSLTYKFNIPKLCAKCHLTIYQTYQGSIHGQAIKSGIPEAPVCTDCHGEHTIVKPLDPLSKVSPGNIPKTCAACHEEIGIVKKFGLAAKRYATYLDSYHGIASKFGEAVVANCASCHGVHDILPSSDPRSSVHKSNLPKTCGKCHPGASENFARGNIHIEATKESSKGVYYVRQFYTWFIGILMVGFVLYIILDIYGARRRKKLKERT